MPDAELNVPIVARRRRSLSPAIWGGVLTANVVLHAAVVWALSQFYWPGSDDSGVRVIDVRLVAAELPPGPKISVPPPGEVPPPREALAAMVEPPPPDLPPPSFPVRTAPPPGTGARAQTAAPAPKVHPPQVASLSASHPASAATEPAAPRTVGISQLSYLIRPNPDYPARARRNHEQGEAMVRVLVDAAGQPSQVSLQTSSGHPTLDESAVAAVRAARFRPYSEGGVPEPVLVLVPVNFVLE